MHRTKLVYNIDPLFWVFVVLFAKVLRMLGMHMISMFLVLLVSWEPLGMGQSQVAMGCEWTEKSEPWTVLVILYFLYVNTKQDAEKNLNEKNKCSQKAI